MRRRTIRINVPKDIAEIRLRSYEVDAWPRALGVGFARHNLLTGLGLAAVLSAIMALAVLEFRQADRSSPFYAVIPHGVMVSLFGIVFLFAVIAMAVGVMPLFAMFARLIRSA